MASKIISNSPSSQSPPSAFASVVKNYSEFKEAQVVVKSLNDAWQQSVVMDTEISRQKRYHDIDVENERSKGNLSADDLYVPVRLCDTNIRREQARYTSYLTQSSRAAIFSANEDPTVNTGPLERDFTTRCRYSEWEVPYLRWIDGAQTHGWDGLEIVYDDTKPGHFMVEHIGREMLRFPLDTKNVQSCAFIVRVYEFTAQELVEFTQTRGWNEDQVLKIVGQDNNDINTTKVSLFKVEKFMFKDHGKVFVAWMCAEKCSDWLRPPRPLFNGRVSVMPSEDPMVPPAIEQLQETTYPVEIFPYVVGEDSKIINIKGRVFQDEYMQEAVTSLMSSYVTAHRRGAEFYFSRKDNAGDVTNIDEAQTEIKLLPGRIFNLPVEQFQLIPPNEGMLRAVQGLISENQQETSQVNYATMNRKDSRKTATEIEAATQEGALLSSVQVTLLSIALRNVFTRCFLIYSSRASAGLIKVTPEVDALLQGYTYTLKPSGDTDVIERQQKVMTMQRAWPVYAKTAAAPEFLADLTKLLFPDEAPRYIAALKNGDQKMKLLAAAYQVINSLVKDPQTGQLTPEAQPHAQQLQQLDQQFEQVFQAAGGGGSPQQDAPTPQ